MPKHAFRTVFWGLVVVFLDVRLNGFDILPDPLGYLIVVAGLSRIKTNSPGLAQALQWSLLLILLSIAGVFSREASWAKLCTSAGLFSIADVLPQGPSVMSVLGFTLAAARVIVFLLFIGALCEGIAEWAGGLKKKALARTAKFRGMASGMLIVASLGVGIMAVFLRYEDAGFFVLTAVLSLLIAFVLVLRLVWRAGNELESAGTAGME